MIYITITENDVKEAADKNENPIAYALNRKLGGDWNIETGFYGCEATNNSTNKKKMFTYSGDLSGWLQVTRGSINYRKMFPAGKYGLFVN